MLKARHGPGSVHLQNLRDKLTREQVSQDQNEQRDIKKIPGFTGQCAH